MPCFLFTLCVGRLEYRWNLIRSLKFKYLETTKPEKWVMDDKAVGRERFGKRWTIWRYKFLVVDRDLSEAGEEEEEEREEKGTLAWYLSPPSGESIQGYDPIHLGFCFLPMASLFPQTRSFCLCSDEVLLFGSQPSPRVDHCLPSICSVSLYPGPSVAWIQWEIPLSQSQGFSLPFAEHLCAFLIVFLSHYLAVLKQVIPLWSTISLISFYLHGSWLNQEMPGCVLVFMVDMGKRKSFSFYTIRFCIG